MIYYSRNLIDHSTMKTTRFTDHLEFISKNNFSIIFY